jgi:ribokinase
VDAAGENVIYVSSGANVELAPDEFGEIAIGTGDIMSATSETSASVTKVLFEKAKAAGATTVLNAAPAVTEARELFDLVDFLIVNETELSFLTDMPATNSADATAAMRTLALEKTNIITTLGKAGVIALIRGETITVKGHSVQVVDSTGAGDCFVGAFVTALQEHGDAQKAMDFANAAAAVSVQRLGASSSMPKREEVGTFIGQRLVHGKKQDMLRAC